MVYSDPVYHKDKISPGLDYLYIYMHQSVQKTNVYPIT